MTDIVPSSSSSSSSSSSCDTIENLGRLEGKRFDICPNDNDEHCDEISRTIKFIRVTQRSETLPNLLWARGEEGFKNHDNAPRMPFVCSFLNLFVLPCLSPQASNALKRKQFIPIELHDTCKDSIGNVNNNNNGDSRDSHLNDSYKNTWVFSRDRAHESPVLIPDPYQMSNYGGMLDRIDDRVPWANKIPKMFFSGTTTGDRDPKKNERIQRCIWSLDNREISEFYITHVAQMDVRHALSEVPRLSRAIQKRFPEDHHTKYRIAANIAGNTCSWSRIPAVMCTKSVLFDFEHPDVEWYSPALKDGVHYVNIDRERGSSLRDRFHYYVSDENKSRFITDNANSFVREYMRSIHAAQYMRHLIESSAYHSAA